MDGGAPWYPTLWGNTGIAVLKLQTLFTDKFYKLDFDISDFL